MRKKEKKTSQFKDDVELNIFLYFNTATRYTNVTQEKIGETERFNS